MEYHIKDQSVKKWVITLNTFSHIVLIVSSKNVCAHVHMKLDNLITIAYDIQEKHQLCPS